MIEKLILGKNCSYEIGGKDERRNANVLIVGGSGSGKTYSFVQPNLLETRGSLIVSDPKGFLEKKYRRYFEKSGYHVYILDLVDFRNNTETVNFMKYISTEQDFVKLANKIVFADKLVKLSTGKDPFWDNSSEALLACLLEVAYMISDEKNNNLATAFSLFAEMENTDESYMDNLIAEIKRQHGNCLAVSIWNKLPRRAEKTFDGIISTLSTILSRYQTEEMKSFLALEKEIHFERFMEEKSCLFIKVSDVDDTYYNFANIIYSTALEILCKYADQREDGRCPINVRFFLDDFSSNVVINNMGRLSAQVRGRNISLFLVIQSLAQLKDLYGKEGDVIKANCDTMVFLSATDLDTANELSIRLDKPIQDILYMPIGKSYVLRRGTRPREVENYDVKEHPEYFKLCELNKGKEQ